MRCSVILLPNACLDCRTRRPQLGAPSSIANKGRPGTSGCGLFVGVLLVEVLLREILLVEGPLVEGPLVEGLQAEVDAGARGPARSPKAKHFFVVCCESVVESQSQLDLVTDVVIESDIDQRVALQVHADLKGWYRWKEIVELTARVNHGDVQIAVLPGIVAVHGKMVARTSDLVLWVGAIGILFGIKIGVTAPYFQVLGD